MSADTERKQHQEDDGATRELMPGFPCDLSGLMAAPPTCPVRATSTLASALAAKPVPNHAPGTRNPLQPPQPIFPALIPAHRVMPLTAGPHGTAGFSVSHLPILLSGPLPLPLVHRRPKGRDRTRAWSGSPFCPTTRPGPWFGVGMDRRQPMSSQECCQSWGRRCPLPWVLS